MSGLDALRCPTHGMKLCGACATVTLTLEAYEDLSGKARRVDKAEADLDAERERGRALSEAIAENTFHDVDEYTQKCLPHCWRCELAAASSDDREAVE